MRLRIKQNANWIALILLSEFHSEMGSVIRSESAFLSSYEGENVWNSRATSLLNGKLNYILSHLFVKWHSVGENACFMLTRNNLIIFGLFLDNVGFKSKFAKYIHVTGN